MLYKLLASSTRRKASSRLNPLLALQLLSEDAWDAQMLFVGQHGYRVIAHDRRGHGRSGQSWKGNNLDTYADDLAELIEALDLNEVCLIGHSTGGGEVTRYIGRHGNKRLSKLVLMGAIPPVMLKSDKNPDGLPLSVLDDLRAGVVADRSQLTKDFSLPSTDITDPTLRYRTGFATSFGCSQCRPLLLEPTIGFPYLSGAGRLIVKDMIMLAAAVVTLADAAKVALLRQANEAVNVYHPHPQLSQC